MADYLFSCPVKINLIHTENKKGLLTEALNFIVRQDC